MPDLSGNLGRYSLGDGLGPPGGYGAAFKARRDDGVACVVKLIHGFLDPSQAELDRLLVMLEHLATVESDHVVPIIDAGVDRTATGALPWIAMLEIPGARSLRDVIGDSQLPLGPQAARRIGIDVAQGLADLHAANLLHRDVKPGNLLLDAHGRAQLIDFEIVKIQHLTTRTARAAEPLGTELYMAPEQLHGPVVPETDLWALGLVLAELLTGHQPVRAVARRRADLRRVIATEHLVPAGLPGDWPDLLDALLRKLPSARPESAHAVVEWLRATDAQPLLVRPLRQSPRWRWGVQTRDDIAAAEQCAGDKPQIAGVDAAGPARCNRLRRAAKAMPAKLAFEPTADDGSGQLSLDDPDASATDAEDDYEREVLTALRAQRDANTDTVLLPWMPIDEANADDAIEMLRLGLRNSHLAGDKPVIATIQLPTGALTNPADALQIAAVLCALRPDGWRLLVDGLQPGCGANVLNATADMASALASRADVWVRAGGLARWALATIAGVSVTARSGRGLWTRGDGQPRHIAERVEVARLAGPIPREIAERIGHARPALMACDCRVCALTRELLPPSGPDAIVHNVGVVDRQLAAVLARPLEARADHVADVLRAAKVHREVLPELIGWHGELEDLDDVLGVAEDRSASPRAGLTLLRFA